MTPPVRDRVALAGVVLVVLLAQVVLYPGIRFTVEALGASPDIDASMWFLVAEFSAFVAFAVVWGALSDRLGRRVPLIIVGAVGGALGYLALAAVPLAGFELGFEQILAVRVVQGAMTIGAFSLALTMLMDLPGGHGANMGAAGIAIGLGTAAGAPLGGLLAERDPLLPLVAAGLLLLCVTPLVLAVPDRAPGPGPGRRFRAVLGELAGTPAVGLPYAFGFIDRLTAGFFALVGVFYFQDVFGLDAADTGLVLALFFGPFALLQFPMGVLSDRIGRAGPVVIGSVCYGIGIIAVGAAPSLPVAAAGMVAVGVLGALVAPATMALVTDLASPTGRASAMAGFNVAGSLGFLTGFLLGGTAAATLGYLAAFLIVGGLEIAIAVLAAPAFLRLELPLDPSFGSE